MPNSAEEYEDFASKTYAPVNQCIFCGATDELSDEHILPFGLSGTTILPKASCRACAKITCRFEAQVLRGPMRAVRILRGIASRSGHEDAPKTSPLTIVRGGSEEVVHLPLEKHPAILAFPIFPVPALLDPAGSRRAGPGTGLETSYL